MAEKSLAASRDSVDSTRTATRLGAPNTAPSESGFSSTWALSLRYRSLHHSKFQLIATLYHFVSLCISCNFVYSGFLSFIFFFFKVAIIDSFSSIFIYFKNIIIIYFYLFIGFFFFSLLFLSFYRAS